MAAEVTMICMDTSSWMSGNKSPRFLAQVDAIELYCKQKFDFHPENCVGILAMGESASILVKPTRDLRKIMSGIYGTGIDDDHLHIVDALKSASQYLKEKTLQKRIVFFAGGPIYRFKHDLIKIGTKLKKKCVAIDVVKNGPKGGVILEPFDYGPLKDSYTGQSRKENLKALVAAANDNDNSHIKGGVFLERFDYGPIKNNYPGQSKKENLEALVAAANDNGNSHILHVPEDQLSIREHYPGLQSSRGHDGSSVAAQSLS